MWKCFFPNWSEKLQPCLQRSKCYHFSLAVQWWLGKWDTVIRYEKVCDAPTEDYMTEAMTD